MVKSFNLEGSKVGLELRSFNKDKQHRCYTSKYDIEKVETPLQMFFINISYLNISTELDIYISNLNKDDNKKDEST
ncbi:hypothetical protein [Candidatus Hodgkinia cicadicola]|uniref:hypothetical protein n=1 Tax=Candidatus Hodgkinia cicadicola TaxID=573658 RepID=UPI0011BA6C25